MMDNNKGIFGNLVNVDKTGEVEEKAFLLVDEKVVGVTKAIEDVENYISSLDYGSTVIVKVGSVKQCLKEQNDIECIDAVLESNGGEIGLPVMKNTCTLVPRSNQKEKLDIIYRIM
jgi:hypothetical protein